MDTIKNILEPIIGTYQAQTINTIKTVTDGTITTITDSVVIIPDYLWLLSALVFVVALYSVFRAIGGMLKWKI